ncbi:hypothetical protein ACFVVC_01880 [Pseudarthrobacter sp. NPDC058196]|uniref:hypothetical protein n=1 Tax=Pseudarthrobacter sp. NPDC058196 TaxID=3346376 RepID=UPI0036D97E4E
MSWSVFQKAFSCAAAALVVLCGCESPAAMLTAVTSSPAISTSASIQINLYTHCGINEMRIQDTYFVADEPLDDGHGNPPPGWGNPYQAGSVTVTGSSAVFRDDNGHTVAFHARPGAAGFLKTCS